MLLLVNLLTVHLHVFGVSYTFLVVFSRLPHAHFKQLSRVSCVRAGFHNALVGEMHGSRAHVLFFFCSGHGWLSIRC